MRTETDLAESFNILYAVNIKVRLWEMFELLKSFSSEVMYIK
jgi:hypothetical protein